MCVCMCVCVFEERVCMLSELIIAIVGKGGYCTVKSPYHSILFLWLVVGCWLLVGWLVGWLLVCCSLVVTSGRVVESAEGEGVTVSVGLGDGEVT